MPEAAALRAEINPRHPLDPEPTHATKAAAVLALGVAAVITGPVVAGVVPASVALILTRQAYPDLLAGQGYLTGARALRIGVLLSWIGLILAVTALATALIFGVITFADGGGAGQDFPSTSN